MNIESRRDLQLLLAVEGDSGVTQRILAKRFGMALGLTNNCLKRLAKCGYIKCDAARSHRVAYTLTGLGRARRARLMQEFIQYSLRMYADARRHMRRTVQTVLSSGVRRVAVYGTDEGAEVAYLCLKEAGLEPVAIFGDGAQREFMGFPVRSIREHRLVDYDHLLLASLDGPARRVSRFLLNEGVPREKVINLSSSLGAGAGMPTGVPNSEDAI